MVHRREFFAFTIISASLLLSACSQSQQVSYQSGGMTQTWEGGKEAEKTFALPIYPNSKAAGGVKAEGNEDSSEFVILNSSDPVNKVADYYKSELEKQGWKVSRIEPAPNLVNMTALKPGHEASVMVSLDDKDKTSITLAVSKESEGIPQVTDQNYTPDKLNPPTD